MLQTVNVLIGVRGDRKRQSPEMPDNDFSATGEGQLLRDQLVILIGDDKLLASTTPGVFVY